MVEGAKGQLENEIGEELDWKKLDPRQYDPRRIIREALADEDSKHKSAADLNKPTVKPQSKLAEGERAPFDTEAT